MRKPFLQLCIILSLASHAQTGPEDSVRVHPFNFKQRQLVAAGTSVAGFGGSIVLLNETWYKNYPRSSFHSFNDGGEWLQVDKVGHAWTAYMISNQITALWKWGGVSSNKAVLYGTGTSLLYLFSIEYLDGLSAEWGWSWYDAGADIAGSSLFALQEFAWKEQRINLKFSSHHKKYASPELRQKGDELFGSSLPERLLKDYNAQTYWLSFNLKSFFPRSPLPDWLNIAVGYGANGMYGGYQNIAYDKSGNLSFDRRDIGRHRQWYISPDIDLTRIRTKSKILKTAFSIVNILKIPAPAIEFSNNKLKGKAIAF